MDENSREIVEAMAVENSSTPQSIHQLTQARVEKRLLIITLSRVTIIMLLLPLLFLARQRLNLVSQKVVCWAATKKKR